MNETALESTQILHRLASIVSEEEVAILNDLYERLDRYTCPAPAESTRADWKEIAREKGLMMLDRSGLILPDTIELQRL